jgi:hypothetical protein
VCTDSVVRPLNPLLERYSAVLQATFAPMRPGRRRSYWRYAFPDRAELATSFWPYYETIASARSVIAARFHAMIFCLLAGTPFLAVSSNTTKIESVLEDVFGGGGKGTPIQPSLAIGPARERQNAIRLACFRAEVASGRREP